MVASVAGLGLLAWGVLRTGGGTEPLPTDAEGLVRVALERMELLDSYRVDIVDSEVGSSATVEVMSNGLIAVRTAEITSTVLGSVSAEESVFTADSQYDRFCQDYPVACGPWTANPRPLLINIGATVIYPDWPLIALERTEDLRILPQDASRPGTIEIAGTFEPSIAKMETALRHLPPEEANEFLIRTGDDSMIPATIHTWISGEDVSIDRILIEFPGGALGSSKTLGFYYSRFNEVTITPPTDFIPIPTPTPSP